MNRKNSSPFALRFPELPDTLTELESWIDRREAHESNLKPGTQARIIWNESQPRQKTEYALVYLHGFSASQGEGRPLHTNIAEYFGMNLYLSRLAGHGYKGTEGFRGLTAQALVDSAVKAYTIGQKLGRKVILMGTSTGASLALYLASQISTIAGLLAYSPLIDFYDGWSWIIKSAPLRRLARLWPGNGYIVDRQSGLPNEGRIWNAHYRLEGLLALGELVEKTMKPQTFIKITQPLWLGYYFKNERQQDQTVSVDEMLQMFDMINTPISQKKKQAFPEASSHVITSTYTSNSFKKVEAATINFLNHTLNLTPIKH